MSQQTEKFDLWCIIKLFGHQQIAGKCTEQNIAGTNMLRVDVPETDKQPAFTKFYGSSAIYAINPVDETTAVAKAKQLNIAPIQVWNIQSYLDKQVAANVLPYHQEKISDGNDDPDDDELW
jgi:hypothetical protein